MKHNCNIVRDLIPLALDGAASNESQTLLDEHLEECQDCRAYYRGMQAALPAGPSADGEQEQKAFGEAAWKLRKKRRRRLWRNVLLGVLAGLLVLFAGLWTWSFLTQRDDVFADLDSYGIFLSQLEDGRVSVNIDYQGYDRRMSVRVDKLAADTGGQTLYVYHQTTRLPQRLGGPMRNYSCTLLSPENMAMLAEIRKGWPENSIVVWRAGDSIPAASPEMERYFALQDQIIAISMQETADGKLIALSDESASRLQELDQQAWQMRSSVPEWQ